MYRYFGVTGYERSESLILLASIVFWFLSVTFFVWVARVRNRVPEKYGRGVERLIFGFISSFDDA
jgi:hypothetical protein